MATSVEETALATKTEEITELAPSMSAAAVEAEIRSAITIAVKFPRKEERAFEKLMKSCQRPAFAEDASYSFPRAGTDITGPSIYLAREAARVWGNIRHGVNVVADDEESRTIEAWAWDLETNAKVYAQDTFRKLIYRKKGGWQKPDERDLRELTNRRGAILKRNCILELLPTDLIDDARNVATATLRRGAAADPEAAKKKVIMAFSGLNVTPDMLEQKLGHPLGECSPAEIAELRQIYKSIADGNSTWSEYVEPKKPETEKGSLRPEDLKPSASENRGHGNENLGRSPQPQAPAPSAQPASDPAAGKGRGKPPEAKPATGSTGGNPNYSDREPDPFAPGGDLFGKREPGREG
jgi:hypothetical protein